jgi:ribose transport system substrate-binding protein
MKKTLSFIVVMIMVCALFAGCAPAPETPDASPEVEQTKENAAEETSADIPSADAPEKTYKAAFLAPDMADESQGFSAEMFEKHAAEYGFEITNVDAKGEAAKQAQDVTTMIAQGIDVIFVCPNDPSGIVPSLMEAKQAGLIVGLFSSDLAEENHQYRDFMVGADDYLGGKAAAEAFIKQFPSGAKIVEIGGQAGHDAQLKRHQGFVDGLEGSNIEVLDTQNCKTWSTSDALNIMQDFIVKYGDEIEGVFCHWDNGYTGVIQAMTAADLDPASIFSVGVDGNRAGYDQVADGTQTISLAQDFEIMVIDSLKVARKVLDAETFEPINFIPWVTFSEDTVSSIERPHW